MTSLILYFYALLTLVQMCSSLKLDKGPKQKFKSNQIADESTNKPSILLPFKKIKDITATIVKSNPIGILASNIYDFFYWLPRRNILYDQPPVFWRNSTAQYIQWYQVPHNLPPYRYLDNDWPDDFFCYGLPGNTLPLGDWDPFGFQLVSKKVVFKYRESELKHGRLSMLAFVGMLLQEEFHPWHNDIGGLAITQMDRLLESPVSESIFYKLIVPILTFLPESIQRTIENTVGDTYIPIDYAAVVLFLISFEATALYRNWGRWKLNEFNHQFDHNIGIGNLKEVICDLKVFIFHVVVSIHIT